MSFIGQDPISAMREVLKNSIALLEESLAWGEQVLLSATRSPETVTYVTVQPLAIQFVLQALAHRGSQPVKLMNH